MAKFTSNCIVCGKEYINYDEPTAYREHCSLDCRYCQYACHDWCAYGDEHNCSLTDEKVLRWREANKIKEGELKGQVGWEAHDCPGWKFGSKETAN